MVGAASGTHNHKNRLAPVNPPIWAPSFVLPRVISAGVGLILLSPAKLSVVTRTPIANGKTAGTKRCVGCVWGSGEVGFMVTLRADAKALQPTAFANLVLKT